MDESPVEVISGHAKDIGNALARLDAIEAGHAALSGTVDTVKSTADYAVSRVNEIENAAAEAVRRAEAEAAVAAEAAAAAPEEAVESVDSPEPEHVAPEKGDGPLRAFHRLLG